MIKLMKQPGDDNPQTQVGMTGADNFSITSSDANLR